MFRNYLLVAIRTIRSQKIYSGINILGLSFGVALSVLVFLFLRSASTYEAFHENAGTIYRVGAGKQNADGSYRWSSSTSIPLAVDLKESFPEIQHATRFMTSLLLFKVDGELFEERFTFVDPDFFEMFTIDVIAGNAEAPLANRNALVVSEKMAQKYFGESNPIGKRLPIKIA